MSGKLSDINQMKNELMSLEKEEKKANENIKNILDKKRRRYKVFQAGIIVEMAGLLYDYDDEKLLKVLIENRYSIIR